MRYTFTVEIETEGMSNIEKHEELEAVIDNLRGLARIIDFEEVE